MSTENLHDPIELPELTSTSFGMNMADVNVGVGDPELVHPMLTLEGEQDAFTHTFEDGRLDVREKDQGGTTVTNIGGRGGSFSTIVSGGGSVGNIVIGGGTVRINGVEVTSSDSITIGSDARRRASLLLPPNHPAASHNVDTLAGNVELDNVTASVLRIASQSGDIAVRAAVADNIELKTISGDVDVEETKSPNSVSAKSMSGDIDVSNSEAPSWRLSTMSGNVKVKSTTGEVDASSMSGRTRVS